MRKKMKKKASFMTDNIGWLIFAIIILGVIVYFIMSTAGGLTGLGRWIRDFLNFGGGA